MSGHARVVAVQPVVIVSSFFTENALHDAGISDGLMFLVLGWVILLGICIGWAVGGGK